MESFHFLRPEWLWGFVPLLGLLWLLAKKASTAQVWKSVCDPHLLPHLLVGTEEGRRWAPIVLLGLSWMLAIFALAGPVWSKLPQPVFRAESALVIVLDLSRSMDAQDIAPSRVTRAKHKILDILQSRKEGQTALVVFAGDAFVVSPLTDDAGTMVTLVQSLETEIMPLQGSRADLGLRKGHELLKQAGIPGGDLLLMTDGEGGASLIEVVEELRAQNRRVSVLGVGTEDGAPIPEPGGFLKDQDGSIVVPKLDRTSLEVVARAGGGQFETVTLDDQDIDRLLPSTAFPTVSSTTTSHQRTTDLWQEEGPWLVIALLALVVPAFRPGWLGMILALVLVPQMGHASSWENLWLRPDQQGVRALDRAAPEEAVELFQDPAWKGIANYQAENYQEAEQNFSQLKSPEGDYNRGNALAKLGRYEEALASYQSTLKQQPDHADAQHNLEVIKKLLENHQTPPQKGNQSQESDSSSTNEESGGDQAKDEVSKQSADSTKEQTDGGQGDSEKESPGESQSLTDSDPSSDAPNSSGESQQQAQKDSESKKAESKSAKENTSDISQSSPSSPGEDELDSDENPKTASAPVSDQAPETEKSDQVLQQWLRRIPDDPGGLLRRKFLLEHRRRMESGEQMNSQGSGW